MIGWGTVVLGTVLAFIVTNHSSLNPSSAHFFVIFSMALILWIFRLVPESIPAFFIITTTMMFNMHPQHIILSGFISDSFYTTLSLFAIGFVLIKSRLFYRFSLFILYYLPPNHSLLQKTLFGIGALMTPIISVQSARVTLITPLLNDIITCSKINPRSDSANALASAAFNGCILLSTIFLTGKSSNAILLTMLTDHHAAQTTWSNWLLAASFPGLLLIGCFFLMQSLFFKQKSPITINKLHIKRESLELKQCSYEEWGALLSIITLLSGLIFSTWYDCSKLWTCLAVFFVLLFTGAMETREIKTGINWTFLFYLGAIIGIMRYIQNIGIDLWLGQHLNWLIALTHHNVMFLIIGLYLISWISGLLLGTMTAPALLFTVVLPITQQFGFNCWVAAFIILMATEAWIFPYQSNYYLCFEELLKKGNQVHLKPLLYLNASMALLRLFILLASIPFWQWVGLI